MVDGISVQRVSKRFKRVRALTDVNLEVEPGEIVALIGPNGAGKSTLLRILGTTVLPDAGRAFIAGHDVTSEAGAARRATGFLLADERSWYWRLTGRHNLEFFAALQGLRRPEASRRAGELLAEVGLEEAADRQFGGYSAGMRLRLSLARALLMSPPVLLLDEPTRSLDPVATAHFRDLMLDTARERRPAILIATHDLYEAAALASRVVILRDGRIAAMRGAGGDAASLEGALLAAQG